MKDTIVFWGTNENDQKIMTVLRLSAAEKKVEIWTFAKDKLNDDFVEKMFADWESIDVASFPEATSFTERDVTEGALLPENIRADKTDLIIRAEQDWRFKVLSVRVAEMLTNEVLALQEQINATDRYDKDLWESAKSYNAKVMAHAKERTLAYDQINGLRSLLNDCFEKLKALMSKNNEKYEEEASANKKMAVEKINSILQLSQKNNQINDAFEELKKVQNHIKEIRLTRDGRKEIWDLLNEAFTQVKGLRKSQVSNRLAARMVGLEKAINKMQNSIDMDKESVDFQNKKAGHVNATKLEMQLREAKIKMIESRITSKQVKLDDMRSTMDKLKRQSEQEAKKATDSKAKKGNNSKKSSEKKAETPKGEKAKKSPEKKAEAPKEEKAEAPKGEKAEAPKGEKAEAPKGEKAEAPKEEKAEAPKEEKADAPAENKVEAPKENTVVAPVEEPAEAKKEEQASSSENEAAVQAEEPAEEAEKSEEEVELKTEASAKPEDPENGSAQPAENEENPVPPVKTEDKEASPQAVENTTEILHEPRTPEDEEE